MPGSPPIGGDEDAYHRLFFFATLDRGWDGTGSIVCALLARRPS